MGRKKKVEGGSEVEARKERKETVEEEEEARYIREIEELCEAELLTFLIRSKVSAC